MAPMARLLSLNPGRGGAGDGLSVLAEKMPCLGRRGAGASGNMSTSLSCSPNGEAAASSLSRELEETDDLRDRSLL